jgi:hypothetical protein
MTSDDNVMKRFFGLSGGEQDYPTISSAELSYQSAYSFADLSAAAILASHFELSLRRAQFVKVIEDHN